MKDARLVTAFIVAPLVPALIVMIPFIQQPFPLAIILTLVFAYALTGIFMVPLFQYIEDKGWYSLLSSIVAPFLGLFVISFITNVFFSTSGYHGIGGKTLVSDGTITLDGYKFFLYEAFLMGLLGALAGVIFYYIRGPSPPRS